MKILIFNVAFCIVCNILIGCHSNGFQEDEVITQLDITLISPKGIRIANSVEELTKMLSSSNTQPINGPITITKIVYNWGNVVAPRSESIKKQKAAIYYKTLTGEVGVYFVEISRS
ncbi:hypothetical protein [Spirosoma lituiforme]